MIKAVVIFIIFQALLQEHCARAPDSMQYSWTWSTVGVKNNGGMSGKPMLLAFTSTTVYIGNVRKTERGAEM